MDYQSVVDHMSAMACVVSVERHEDGRRGPFRVVTGNAAYIDSIEHPAPGAEMLTKEFVPNSEYTRYLTRDLNFEDYCYRAAVEKKCLHSYVSPDRMSGIWLNMTFLPLIPDDGKLSYCIYMMEISFEASSENMSNISGDRAAAVLETSIKLRGTKDFRETIKDVICDVREMCDAEHCCILLVDDIRKSCEVLGESFAEGSKLLPMQRYLDGSFYAITETWPGTIAGSNCLIIKDEQDMEVIKERNPVWYESLTAAGAKSIVFFPLKSAEQTLAYMWALNFDSQKAVEIKETMEIASFILGSEIGNYLLVDRLKLLSSRDMLTGVMNRNEMNNFVDGIATKKEDVDMSVGVIFADLNGLKEVNDKKGHAAGDRLLQDAADVLRQSFDESDIYRAGGDEFSIIVCGLTEEGIAEKIKEIRRNAEKSGDVSFAMGGSSVPRLNEVRQALRKADERMYEDKRKYYETHERYR